MQVGLPRSFGTAAPTEPGDQPWTSAIFKDPVSGPLWLGKLNLDGDAQANLEAHGGPERAVLAYSWEHYALWEAELGVGAMPLGGFGENFTFSGLSEADVCLGDVYRVGAALVQVSEPRRPCFKLANRLGVKDMVARVNQTGRSGWYMRTLEEGFVSARDTIDLIERPCREWSMARVNFVVGASQGSCPPEELLALAGLPLLSAEWREKLIKRASRA